MNNARPITALVTLTLIAIAASAASATQGVSPGAVDRMAQVNNPCPTFSWQEDDRARLYEVAAYAIHENDDPATTELTAESEVLYSRVPGGATSWTPSAEQCFAPGGRYVWFVRAVHELAGDQVIEASEWSKGRYFSIPAAPSAEEMQRALEVIRRWEAGGGGEGSASTSGVIARSETETETGTRPGTLKSIPTASAAIRGDHPSLTGEAYGVVGTSSADGGAGVAAAHLDGGPDLVLDGSVDGEADTVVWEWGMDRPSATDETFALRNSGAGRLHLDVDGHVTTDVLRTEEVVVTGMTVIDDAREWQGAGSTVPCTSCVSSSDIADGTVTSSDIADGAVTSSDIADGAVINSKIVDTAITTRNLRDGAVTASKIGDDQVRSQHMALDAVSSLNIVDGTLSHRDLAAGAVTEVKLATDAVTSAKILDRTITAADLAPDAVSAGQIADGAVTTGKLANAAVTSAKIADGAVISTKLPFAAVTMSKIADGAVSSAKIANGAVTGAKIANGSVATNKIAVAAITSDKFFYQSVTNAAIADNAVSKFKLASNSVTSTKIVDGTITAADVDETGGIYAGRDSLYESWSTELLPAGSNGCVTASCNDSNDLPLSFSCYKPTLSGSIDPNSPLNGKGFKALGWTDVSNAAGAKCCFENGDTQGHNIRAKIACVEVAGP